MAFDLGTKNRDLLSGIQLVKCGGCGRGGVPLSIGGQGRKAVLVVFDQPSSIQSEQNSWFVVGGESAVFAAFARLGYNLERDLWVTAVLPCYGQSGNNKYEHCRPRLKTLIHKHKPMLIVAVGEVATGAVLREYNPEHFKQNFTSCQYYSRCIPLNLDDLGDWGCWLLSVQSDNEIRSIRNEHVQRVAKDWVFNAIKDAVEEHQERPSFAPNPHPELLFDSCEVADVLACAENAKYVAFDYETTSLQPEMKGARILSVGLTLCVDGKELRTVAFPMASALIRRSWCLFLQSKVPKIGANIKFEHRWSIVHLRSPVVNWLWDVCVGGRILDCCPGNSGLKYLAFVDFGVVGYDDAVEEFMSGGNEDGSNLLDQVDPSVLLTYNAYDSYFTMLCFRKQRKLLGMKY